MKRKLETYSQPGGPVIAPVASPEKMKAAHYLICRRASDPPPSDIASATEFPGWCQECGEAIIHRALPNPDVALVCIYCWHEWGRQ